MHKTEKTAKESRMNFMYSHLCDTTLARSGRGDLAGRFAEASPRSRLAVPPLRSRSMAVCAKSAARRSAIFRGCRHVAVTASASLLSIGITKLIRIPVWRLHKRGRPNLCGEAVELAIEPFQDFHVDEHRPEPASVEEGSDKATLAHEI
jgi:hypothetical protein